MTDTSDNQPWSERYRLAAKEWVVLESAASLLEGTKTAVLAQRKAQQGDIPDSHSERIVKASPEWMDFITKMVKAREAANLSKVKLEFIRMKSWEESSANATKRVEMRL